MAQAVLRRNHFARQLCSSVQNTVRLPHEIRRFVTMRCSSFNAFVTKPHLLVMVGSAGLKLGAITF